MKKLLLNLLLIVVITLFVILTTFANAAAQRPENSEIYIAVKSGVVITKDSVDAFHESDVVFRDVIPGTEGILTWSLYYTDTYVGEAVITLYIFQNGILYKSRFIRMPLATGNRFR